MNRFFRWKVQVEAQEEGSDDRDSEDTDLHSPDKRLAADRLDSFSDVPGTHSSLSLDFAPWLTHLFPILESSFGVARSALVDPVFCGLSLRKKSRHAGQKAFFSIAVPHRPHESCRILEARVLMPYLLMLFTPCGPLVDGRSPGGVPASAVKLLELALLSALD